MMNNSKRTPESPALGPIASMMDRVKLQMSPVDRSPKRKCLKYSGNASIHTTSLSFPSIDHRQDERLRNHEKRSQHNADSDEVRWPLLKKRQKVRDDIPNSEEVRVIINNGCTDQSEIASALALASLVFSAGGKTSKSTSFYSKGGVQVREEEGLEDGRDECPVVRDVVPLPTSSCQAIHIAPNVVDAVSSPLLHPIQSRHSMPPPFASNDQDRRALQYSRLLQMPPPPLPHFQNHSQTQTTQKNWICDICNVASFARYEDACRHEDQCRSRCEALSQGAYPSLTQNLNQADTHAIHFRQNESESVRDDVEDEEYQKQTVPMKSTEEKSWHAGSVSLCVEASDSEWLSEVNCYIRKHCIQAFSATECDVTQTSKRGKITNQQVGIRCKFCSHIPLKGRAVGAVSFPTAISGIYESVKRWQKMHLNLCSNIPPEVKGEIAQFRTISSWVPTTRQYWADSARVLGMVDTPEGIRFENYPQSPCRTVQQQPVLDKSNFSHTVNQSDYPEVIPEGEHIVFSGDEEKVPPYVYYLMRQVEMCRFTEADRFIARSKGPIGGAGFQCCHCEGHAGLGKYYPVSSKTFSTNSTSQNIHAHLLKCRKCPSDVKDKLEQLKTQKLKMPGLPPVWRKTFFEQVWARLHG